MRDKWPCKAIYRTRTMRKGGGLDGSQSGRCHDMEGAGIKISYGILLTQITEEERQEILEEYEEMLQKKEAEHQERLRQKALLPKPPQKRPHMKSLFYKDPEERLR